MSSCKELKSCPQCNIEFEPSGKNHKFCTVKCRDRNRYTKRRQEMLKQKAVYYNLNKAAINASKTEYRRNKRRTDPMYRLRDNLRSRLNKAIQGSYRAGSAVNDLGCSIKDLKKHLEAQFQPGMTWDNYGRTGWHIDHIVPLDSFDLTKLKEVQKACHYTNLQPLWAKDNIKKGNNAT